MPPRRDRSKEREANRLRMAARRACPEYRAKVNAARKVRDEERKASDPELRKRLTENSLRHYRNRASDPEFWVTRKAYLAEWRADGRWREAAGSGGAN